MKLTLATGLFVAASAGVFAQAPAGLSTPQTSTPQRQGSTSTSDRTNSPREQTLTGCLTSADTTYTLTVMDDTGAPGTTAQTTSYTLAPGSGVDLQPYLNKRITVKGTDAGPDAAATNRVEMKMPPTPAATGTSGTGANAGKTPTVQTDAKARINAKTFNVATVQPATGNCGA